MKFKLTTHTLVKNEERWIKPAILSVIDKVDRMLVWDTGSSDKTVSIIKSINSDKIEFKQCGPANREKLVQLRNEQISQTKTDWFLLLDGDEVWPKKNLVKLIEGMKKARPETVALVNKTRNAVGDIYHYLPEDQGHYHIGPWKGHLNIRAIRNLSGLEVKGSYPLEAYTIGGVKLQDMPEKLEFIDTWYLHLTHLKRSGWINSFKVIDRLKKFKPGSQGIAMKPGELPETLKQV